MPGSEGASPLLRREQRLRDVADAAVHLDRVVLAVHIVDREQAAWLRLHDPRIAEVPAAAVVAQHDLPPPGAAVVGADPRADAEWGQPVAVDAGDAPVGHAHEVAGRTPVVDARQEPPGAAAVVAGEDLGPEHAGGVALAAYCGNDASAGKHD